MPESRRRSFVKAVGGAVGVGSALLAGCLGGGPVENTNEVTLTENGFEPKNVHVGSQETLTWINEDAETHTVASASSDLSFESTLEPGQAVGYTFNFDGVYRIVCSEHGSKEDFSGERMKVGVGSDEIEDPVE